MEAVGSIIAGIIIFVIILKNFGPEGIAFIAKNASKGLTGSKYPGTANQTKLKQYYRTHQK